jgi:hypothetical protein
MSPRPMYMQESYRPVYGAVFFLLLDARAVSLTLPVLVHLDSIGGPNFFFRREEVGSYFLFLKYSFLWFPLGLGTGGKENAVYVKVIVGYGYKEYIRYS